MWSRHRSSSNSDLCEASSSHILVDPPLGMRAQSSDAPPGGPNRAGWTNAKEKVAEKLVGLGFTELGLDENRCHRGYLPPQRRSLEPAEPSARPDKFGSSASSGAGGTDSFPKPSSDVTNTQLDHKQALEGKLRERCMAGAMPAGFKSAGRGAIAIASARLAARPSRSKIMQGLHRVRLRMCQGRNPAPTQRGSASRRDGCGKAVPAKIVSQTHRRCSLHAFLVSVAASHTEVPTTHDP